MAHESERIADQLERAFRGDAWHGDSLTKILSDVTPEEAAAHPCGDAHSIWELVHHITVWNDTVRRRLAGEPIDIELGSEKDWPPAKDTSADAWRAALLLLAESHDALHATIAGFDDARLDELAPARQNTNYVVFHGIVQHVIYHSGQIATVKRALRPRR
jgi:uncharacterized damage-inducible protein DinB